jgi:hypothetical protein
MTSDAPCRAPIRSGNPDCLEEPEPLPPPSRQGEQFSRSRAPFLDKCSQERRFRSCSDLREPATDLAALPPTIRLPTLFHPPERSRVGGLDPSSAPRTLRPRARGATRRLSTSAIDTIREHNHESPELHRTSPAVARWRSHSHGCDLSIATLSCGWRRLFRGAASRDFTGQGPCPRQLPRCFGTSRHDRSQRKLRPNPIGSDTSCRCSLRAQTGDVCAAMRSPRGAHHHELAWRHRASGALCRAASRDPPRRGARSAAPEVPSFAG